MIGRNRSAACWIHPHRSPSEAEVGQPQAAAEHGSQHFDCKSSTDTIKQITLNSFRRGGQSVEELDHDDTQNGTDKPS